MLGMCVVHSPSKIFTLFGWRGGFLERLDCRKFPSLHPWKELPSKKALTSLGFGLVCLEDSPHFPKGEALQLLINYPWAWPRVNSAGGMQTWVVADVLLCRISHSEVEKTTLSSGTWNSVYHSSRRLLGYQNQLCWWMQSSFLLVHSFASHSQRKFSTSSDSKYSLLCYAHWLSTKVHRMWPVWGWM